MQAKLENALPKDKQELWSFQAPQRLHLKLKLHVNVNLKYNFGMFLLSD